MTFAIYLFVLSSYKTHMGKCIDYENLQEKDEAKRIKITFDESKNNCSDHWG